MSGLDLNVSLRMDDFHLEVMHEVPADGVTALTGPSGSGKTTLLRVIAGLEHGATGHVKLGGDLWQAAGVFVPAHLRGCGFVFQDARLFEHLDVQDNIAFGARRRGVGTSDIAEIISELDLGPLLKRRVQALSGGEQRRVALARALAAKPGLLLLDEPLSGLDADRKSDVLPYIRRAVDIAGCAAIYVSHDRAEIAALADRVIGMVKGRIAPGFDLLGRLSGRVVACAGKMLDVSIDGSVLRVKGQASVGSRVEVLFDLADATVWADRPPEGTTAGAVRCVLNGIDTPATNVGRTFSLQCGGSVINVQPWLENAQSFTPTVGAHVWLGIARARAAKSPV